MVAEILAGVYAALAVVFAALAWRFKLLAERAVAERLDFYERGFSEGYSDGCVDGYEDKTHEVEGYRELA